MSRWGSQKNNRAQAASAAVAVASQIMPAQDGASDSSVPAFVSKQNMLIPQSSVTGAFHGVEQQIDIVIDRTIGKIIDLNLQFNLTVTDPTGEAPYTLATTPYFVTRVDYMIAGQVIETQYNDTLFAEVVTFQSDQELATTAPLLNVATGSMATGYGFQIQRTSTSNSKDFTFWLPLSGFLPSAQVYAKGFSSEIRVRLYLAPTILSVGTAINNYTTDSRVTVNLNNLYLWAEEAGISREADAQLMQAHQAGINYRSVIRNVWSKTQNVLTANAVQTDTMNSFSADSAALLLYLKSNSVDVAWQTTRFPLVSMYLLDGQGAQLTQVLPAQLVESIVSPGVTPLASSFINSEVFTTYLFPFCSSLDRVRFGKVLGAYPLSGTERVVITPTAETSAAVADQGSLLETVVSWDYAIMYVQAGRVQGVLRSSGSS